MPYFNCEIPQDLFDTLKKMENAQEIGKKMLRGAVPIVEQNLENAIQREHTVSGTLLGSIKTWDPEETKTGALVVSAAPTGKDSSKRKRAAKVYSRSKHGTMTSGAALYNDDKLWWIEFGNSRQPARPFIDRVVRESEQAVADRMQEIFNEEVVK